jgi:hypothetical protein
MRQRTSHFKLLTLDLRNLLKKITNHKEHKVDKGRALCMLHSKLCQQNFCTLHSSKCKTLNPECRELHLHPTLTNYTPECTSLCTGYAYAYPYYAYPGISIHKCPDVHIGMGNSRPDMHEHQLLHEHIKPDMYTENNWKKPNSGYGYMHIRELSGLISGIADISGF